MDEKTKAKDVVLSHSGLMNLIEELKKQSDSQIKYCRRYPGNPTRDAFKLFYGDLINALETHVSKYPVSAPKHTTDRIYDRKFDEVGQLVAFAETLGIKSPEPGAGGEIGCSTTAARRRSGASRSHPAEMRKQITTSCET